MDGNGKEEGVDAGRQGETDRWMDYGKVNKLGNGWLNEGRERHMEGLRDEGWPWGGGGKEEGIGGKGQG